jgi:hypothetical protein
MNLLDKLPRLWGWSVIAILLVILIAILAPQNVPVLIYKLACLTLAAALGYRVDRSLFPYARPHHFISLRGDTDGMTQTVPGEQFPFAAAMIRRALIVLAFVIGIGLIL